MKILLLISGLLFSGGLFADMDNICYANLDTKNYTHRSTIESCERNNILSMDLVYEGWITGTIARWCRYDREIHYVKVPYTTDDRYILTCVLYSNKPRVPQ